MSTVVPKLVNLTGQEIVVSSATVEYVLDGTSAQPARAPLGTIPRHGEAMFTFGAPVAGTVTCQLPNAQGTIEADCAEQVTHASVNITLYDSSIGPINETDIYVVDAAFALFAELKPVVVLHCLLASKLRLAVVIGTSRNNTLVANRFIVMTIRMADYGLTTTTTSRHQ